MWLNQKQKEMAVLPIPNLIVSIGRSKKVFVSFLGFYEAPVMCISFYFYVVSFVFCYICILSICNFVFCHVFIFAFCCICILFVFCFFLYFVLFVFCHGFYCWSLLFSKLVLPKALPSLSVTNKFHMYLSTL